MGQASIANKFMNEFLSQFFSGKYANHKAIGNNFILLLMYRFAYPFAILLNKLHMSPNQITTASTAFALLAFVTLAIDDGWIIFTGCWGVSVLLDFCDGTVARMTNKISKPAFRYDHMSDLPKMFLIFLGAGFRYDNSLIWSITSSVIFLYMYYTVLNHELHNVKKLSGKNMMVSMCGEVVLITRSALAPVPNNRIRDRYRIVAWIVQHNFLFKTFQLLLKSYQALYTVLTTINGHTLLLFFLVPLGPNFTVWAFSYFGLIALIGIRERIGQLLAIPRP